MHLHLSKIISPDHITEISLTSGQEKLSILQNIAHLYEKACDAEDESVKANQAEILCWSSFIIVLDKSLDEIMNRDKVSMKKIKSQVYDFIITQNPGIRRESLYKKIERARKIFRLFEKIGLDKVKYIKSYSANAISKFTNSQIQTIIDHFTKRPDIEYTDDQDNSSDDLPETEVSVTSIPSIPLTHTSSHPVTASGNSEDAVNEDVKSLPETEVDITIESQIPDSSEAEIQVSAPDVSRSESTNVPEDSNYDGDDFFNNNEDDDNDDGSFCGFLMMTMKVIITI
ncbi:246_t:CDS:1 [Ambispora gerdemannii]|uniref:246_t:CDS:1 n=1 Tax=Ambispora gerdemannii TaxID=144530 RepID=A0A9N9DMK1_9GLOM|nr:246_t:CDS:1 [Ambispora gerdemannii]